MKRKIAAMLVAMCVALGVSACGGKESSAPAKEEKEAKEEVSVETADEELSDDEQEEIRLLGQFLDVDLYIDNDGCIKENLLDKDLSHLDVNGTRFELGMSYDDILDLGYKPDNEDFMNKKPGGLAVAEIFTNSVGDTVKLRFSASDDEATVKEGGYLYSIEPEKAFTVAGITESFTTAEVVKSLGSPYRLDCGLYRDYPDAELEYLNSDSNNKYLKVFVNLETDEITSVTLEGYTE